MSLFKRIYRWVKVLILVAWLLFLLLVGAQIAQHNPELIVVDVLFWSSPAASIGVVLCVTFLVGVILGLLVMAPSVFYYRTRLRSAHLKIARESKQTRGNAQSPMVKPVLT